ncbi:methyltransferase domain-containing protein [Dechloromonas denitrificans]|uniref:methyltransferase domain-containing protein n=1 Tax=Dechloromonas denitrificans TaxID=281362 RepID=UPI001CFA8D66|nr:methyltransferase domain-containing protein [Dechloromonas denitrificans]UCV07531.1 methyltransferase domain-containing protein [Dechloromonas denitrificans]
MSDLPPTSTQIKPPEQRPEHPDFWCKRFGDGLTPWDAGAVPAAFAQFIAEQPGPLNTLIPGCGSAWEAAHLAERGWPVTALDFSPVAVATARGILDDAASHGVFAPGAVDLLCADFFTFTPAAPYTLLYERAFLCALPRKLWADWARRVAELLPSGGRLAGFFFLCDQAKGPPFGILPEQLDDLLSPNFLRLTDRAVADSIPVFAGRERWQVWQRR